jgi:hypothetical protein
MMRALSAFALRGRLQALAVICGLAAASLLLPPLSLLSSAVLALVTLRQSAKESASVLFLSLLGLGLLGALLGGESAPIMAQGAAQWLPVWPVALLLRQTRRLDWAVQAAAGFGLLAVALVYLVIDDPVGLWRERLRLLVQSMLENAPPDFDPKGLAQLPDLFAPYLTGAMAGGSIIGVILALLIARWQQAALFNPGGFRSEFVALRLHAGMAYATLACFAAGMLGGGAMAEIAWNLSVVLFLLCTVAGFSVVHALLGSKGFWVVGVYMALLIMPQFLLPPVALLGFSDFWLDWRGRSRQV